jgi:DMSO/TMAO reductase YedYZ molybdopterin-dependent catalytic subunit
MNRAGLSAALALAAAALLAGCGSAAPAAPGPAPEAPPGGAPFLATSLVTPAGTWAVAVMGGSVATNNNFWQLFERPAGGADWKLVTPPGTPDNGGLVLADAGQSMITGFRPSQYLTYTPLTVTRDGGQAWSSASPLDAALANVPDALAAAPASGHLLALTAGGTATIAAPGYTSWTTLATLRSLAATPAGKRCGLQTLTATAFSSAGLPLLGGTCERPGIVGIFTGTGGTWQLAGPALPGSLASLRMQVLRLTSTASGTAALLEAGTGPAASLLAAWSADSGSHWSLSPPFHMNAATPISASFGPGDTAAVILSGNRGETIAGPAAAWRSLPVLPAGTATLAPGPAGTLDALSVKSTRMTVWQLARGAAGWAKDQAINVPIQFGSSS